MRRLVLLGAAVGAFLGAVNLTAALAAGANPGKPSPPGHEQIPPGQAKKADDPGQQELPPGQAAKNEVEPSPSPAKHDARPLGNPQAEPSVASPPANEKRVPPADPRPDAGRPKQTAKPSKPSPTNGNSAVAHTHVIICHRTGSVSNPYVVINISMSAWLHGHSTHPPLNGHSDKVLKQGAAPGEKMPRSACGVPGDITPTDPTRPTPKKPVTPSVPSSDPPSGPPTPQPGGSTSPGSPEGGTGAHGGNDSAVAAEVAQAAVASELPFTGMPLWVAVLAGFWLIGTGLAIRKAFERPSEELARSSDQFTW